MSLQSLRNTTFAITDLIALQNDANAVQNNTSVVQNKASALPIPMRTFQKNPRAQIADVLVRQHGLKLKMFVHDPEECIYLSRSLIENHTWEEDAVNDLLRTMSAVSGGGEYFLDIGANIGVFTMSMAAANFKVIAFEPLQYNIELLNASIESAGFVDRVRLFKIALASKDLGELCVTPSFAGNPTQNNQGNGQLVPVKACLQGPLKLKSAEIVPVRSMDSLLASIPPIAGMCVAAVKIDCEGFEAMAMEGAASVFRGRCPPCHVHLEYNREFTARSGHETGPLVFLIGLGYTCSRKGWEPLRREDNLTFGDGDYDCKLKTHTRCKHV